jgi:hypothetical protein
MHKSVGTISGVPPRLVASPTASYVSDGTRTGSQARLPPGARPVRLEVARLAADLREDQNDERR